MQKPWDIIAALEATDSRLEKEAVIEQEVLAGNIDFFRGARAALDATVTFGIKKIEPKTDNGRGLGAENFWQLAQALAERRLTGNAALTAVAHARMTANAYEWNNWYRRILLKDLRCGVSEKTINSVCRALHVADYEIPVFECQLAHDGANHEEKIIGQKLIEVKLDGVRVITVVYPSGQVTQYSRNGKELTNFETIRAQLAKNSAWFAEPVVLDGEVMSSSFQDLMKQVHRKENVQTDDAVLHLFDILTLREFQAGQGQHKQIDRSYSLQAWYAAVKDHIPNVAIVGQELIDLDTEEGQAQYAEINQQAIAGGYEGLMIKDPAAVYECKRTINWLKKKPFIEVSLTVVGVEEGTGRNEGKLGAFVCEGEDNGKNIKVNVGSGFSDSDRDSFYQSSSSLLGQIVEVRADAVTQNQDGTYSLRFPRFKGFRGFEVGEKI